MDEKLEKVLLDRYKQYDDLRLQMKGKLERINARISELNILIDELGFKFETDTIIKEK